MIATKTLGVLVIRPGKIPVVKGHFADNERGQQWQYEAVCGLRKQHPDAVIVPFTITEAGELWAEDEGEFLGMYRLSHETNN